MWSKGNTWGWETRWAGVAAWFTHGRAGRAYLTGLAFLIAIATLPDLAAAQDSTGRAESPQAPSADTVLPMLPSPGPSLIPEMGMSPETAALQSIRPEPGAREPSTAPEPGIRPFGRFGLGLKSGEAAGAMGIQVAWNFNRHLQASAGAGGMTDLDLDLAFLKDRSRTDSYYLLGKVYWEHLYLSTGYSLKVSKIEEAMSGGVFTAHKSEHGIPFHLGYEFGHREGFYYSTSVGYLYVLGGGDRDMAQGTILVSSKSRTAKSGPSFGMSIGYYLW